MLAGRPGTKRWRTNVQWILSQYGPEQKAIVIAHNFHIARYNEKEEVMGEFLQEQLDTSWYVLGVFAGAGSFHNNSGQEEQLSPPDPEQLDIKHIIGAVAPPVSFLPIPGQAKAGAEWLFEPIIANDTFIDLFGSNLLQLAKCFDGLILLDEVSVPRQ